MKTIIVTVNESFVEYAKNELIMCGPALRQWLRYADVDSNRDQKKWAVEIDKVTQRIEFWEQIVDQLEPKA